MTFDEAFATLIDQAHEGSALSTDRNDPGNWTGGHVGSGTFKGSKYGISAGAYPGEDIAGMTAERARDIYRRDYWGPAGCDAVPDNVKFNLFDMAVNSGVVPARRTLQKAAGVVVDGVIGQQTLAAVQAIPAARLAARFNGARLQFMTDCSNWPSAGRGWARRIAQNLMEV